MIAIKDMEMPKNCVECNHMDLQQAINCQLIYSGCANCGRHPNCPLVEIVVTPHNNVEILDVKKLNSLFPKNKREEKTEWTSKINFNKAD
jgi:hypothetical protein